MRHTFSLLIATVLGAALPQLTLADKDLSDAQASDSPSARLTFIDRRISANIALDAQAEIQLIEFAATHAHHPSVRQFAKAMGKEFDLLAHHMDALSGSLASAIWNLKDGSEHRPESPVRMINAERTAMRIKLEVVCEAASFVEAELKLLPPEEFDSNYLRAFTLRQIQMLGMLKAFERHASPAYADTLAEAAKMVQHGLDQARKLSITLDVAGIKSVDGTMITATSLR